MWAVLGRIGSPIFVEFLRYSHIWCIGRPERSFGYRAVCGRCLGVGLNHGDLGRDGRRTSFVRAVFFDGFAALGTLVPTTITGFLLCTGILCK